MRRHVLRSSVAMHHRGACPRVLLCSHGRSCRLMMLVSSYLHIFFFCKIRCDGSPVLSKRPKLTKASQWQRSNYAVTLGDTSSTPHIQNHSHHLNHLDPRGCSRISTSSVRVDLCQAGCASNPSVLAVQSLLHTKALLGSVTRHSSWRFRENQLSGFFDP